MATPPTIEPEIVVPDAPLFDASPEGARQHFSSPPDRMSTEPMPEQQLMDGDFLDPKFEGFDQQTFDQETNEAESADGANHPNRVRLVARESILNHVLQLRDLGRSHMDVSFHPDANTTIKLHIQSVDGEIIVEALLQEGSPEPDLEWSGLQRSLARDGIELSELQTEARGSRRSPREHAWSDQENHHQPDNLIQADQALAVGAPTEAIPFPGVVTATETDSTWQTWS